MYYAPARFCRLDNLCGALICLLLSLACPARASVNASAFFHKNLVIVGASYAEEWHTPLLPGYTVINNAVCGQITSDIRAHFERDVIELKPDMVLIWGHNNDVIRSTPENMVLTQQRAEENFRAMVEQARAAGITPILVTEVTLPIPETFKEKVMAIVGPWLGKTDYRVQKNIAIKALNAWLRDYAHAQHIKLLDLEKALASGNGTRKAEYARKDHSHITPAGYEAITQYVVAQMT
ncbi:GDSL-type esterase/lipase family protein [Peristeroidobacter soli]|jgi:lysophospholipase L1-like esterase|uniref:GDSL-type esterase/lipase family protein n=1 Tax=Peristeroidobacter soli TaxID=2497877 RepID=UPI00101CF918|nr:GDSL-type esterase/lipase family protein [Peristeroidobacter soli]